MILDLKAKVRNQFFTTFWIAIFGGLLLSGCSSPTPYQINEGRAFGTFYRMVYQSENDLHDEIQALLDSFNLSLSTYEPKSVISLVNQDAEGVRADSFFTKVFETAQEVTLITRGAFDMTVAPLVNAWGFGFQESESVNSGMIDSLLQYVGMDFISMRDGIIVKEKPGVMLDGGAIAKGYGVDVVAGLLQQSGIQNYMVEIGGEVSTSGVNPNGAFWRIGIDRPIDDPKALERELALVVHLSGQALATSGNYRNFYIKDGKKYAHTIDPRTGYPVQHHLLSVTIIAPDCMTADAYATACMVMGLEESIELIEELPDMEGCFIIDGEGGQEMIFSSGFQSYLR